MGITKKKKKAQNIYKFGRIILYDSKEYGQTVSFCKHFDNIIYLMVFNHSSFIIITN